MSTDTVIHVIFALIFAGATVGALYYRNSSSVRKDRPEYAYSPLVSPLLLPLYVLCILVLFGFLAGSSGIFKGMFHLFGGVLLYICLYYVLLLLLLPLLRRYISAKMTAVLWILPNYLYLLTQRIFELDRPAYVISLRAIPVRPIVIVWLCGAALVFGISVLQHLTFRRKLLRSAQAETNPAVLALWKQTQEEVGIQKANIRLMRSAQVSTPLSIGLFRRTIAAILPEQEYTEQELLLIFRHELIHIVHCDSQTKLFLRLCTALCWFNPLMWIAMRRCAEDLELSCDEFVLSLSEEDDRSLYAHLLLESAGDERGFTTCLSAKAKGLKYRLRSIMKPHRQFYGAVAVGVLFFLMLAGSGSLAFAYDMQSADSVLFGQDAVSEDYTLDNVNYYDAGSEYPTACKNPEAILDYVRSLEVSELTGYYTFDSSDYPLVYLNLNDDSGVNVVTLRTRSITVWDGDDSTDTYYLSKDVDWDYLSTLF